MAEQKPDAVALLAPGRVPLTYSELILQVEEVIRKLNACGFGRRDRVAVVLPNGPEMAVAFLSIAAGATCAPLNPAYRAEEFDFYFGDLKAEALLVQRGVDTAARSVAAARGMAVLELIPSSDQRAGIFSLLGDGGLPPEQGGFARPDEAALVLHTSGTTSRPKIVPLTHVNLCASASNIQRTLELTAADRCLNVMPLFHIHGLVGAILTSLVSGASVVCTPGFHAPQFFAWVKEFQPTWYTAVPTMHQAVLARAALHGDIAAHHRFRFIRSSSSALPPRLMAELENVLHVPVIESYGMTEASHQMASNPLPPRRRKPASVGIPAGPEVSVMDPKGRMLSPNEVGEIVIRGANVTPGYENNPEAGMKAFTDGWFRTGDQGYKDHEGYIFITGRIKESINRGGEKISPREIDDVLSDHPAVAQAVAFAAPHPTLGEDVAAAVVLRPGFFVADQELRRFAAGRLADFKVPRQILFLTELPKGQTGKPQRIGLAEKLGLTNPPGVPDAAPADYAAPRTPLEQELARIWGEVLRVERVGVQHSFLQLGGDSILAARIASRVKAAMNLELPLLAFFETPTVAGMAHALETSSAECGPGAPPIRPIARQGELPLSFSQERLWFIDQLEPGSPIYNVPKAFRLRGALDLRALQDALDSIVLRHESLRTVFVSVEGKPVQVVNKPGPVTLEVLDLSRHHGLDREAEIWRLVREESRRSFDLSSDLMLRATLFRLGEEEHILLLVMHHIAMDGWSLGILFRELAELYIAGSRGQAAGLPDLPVQYADFAAWQRGWLQGEVLEKKLSYWKQLFGSRLPVLELPTDRPRPALPTNEGARLSLELSSSLVRSLREVARQEGVTLFMLLLAALQMLLHRYSGQEDIVVGTPVANRNRTEIEGLIGFFVNTLVLRSDLSGNPMFRVLLRRVREMTLAAYSYQDLPFEKLVEEFQRDRDLSRNPLFQVMFVLQNTPGERLEMPGLEVSPIDVDSGISMFDLSLVIFEEDDTLSGFLEYNTHLWEPASIARLVEHFRTLLEGVAADPNQHIAAVPLLTTEERAQVLVQWNATHMDYPREKRLHDLLEEQARDTPDSVAVESGGDRLTYRALNAQANQLARYLMKRGAGSGSMIPLCVNRSLEMAVGIWGILKAGGAYVPLDPAFPQPRLAFMIEDAWAPLIVTQAKFAKAFSGGSGSPDTAVISSSQGPSAPISGAGSRSRPVICLDTDWREIAQEIDQDPASDATPEGLAYVIYTSGSTGHPKGVMIPHRAIVNHTTWSRRAFSLTETDRFLQSTPIGFDASVWELFVPLLAGARLVLPSPGGHLDAAHLIREIVRHRITVLQVVPSMLRELLDDPGFRGCSSLKQVFCGGEVLAPDLVQKFHSVLNAELYNAYGPTEAAVDSTFWTCSDGSYERSVPIGRPIANAKAYILDRQLQPVPIGVPGELHIGGAGLAHGYLHQPELTVEKFIPNPFSDEPGARLYKTGDLARYRQDGNIEFMGRLDDQVKLRGLRIELGEIEAVLSKHPRVREVAVSLATNTAGMEQLAAYIVPQEKERTDIEDLLSFVKSRIPEYMVPARFILQESLPLLPNGKVDRRALPLPDQALWECRQSFLKPRNAVEEGLSEIWRSLLGLERIGAHDNFFELGGHSLLATRVVSRVREVFAVELPLRVLFEAPVLADLASRIILLQRSEAEDPAGILSDVEALSDEAAQRLMTGADEDDSGRITGSKR